MLGLRLVREIRTFTEHAICTSLETLELDLYSVSKENCHTNKNVYYLVYVEIWELLHIAHENLKLFA